MPRPNLPQRAVAVLLVAWMGIQTALGAPPTVSPTSPALPRAPAIPRQAPSAPPKLGVELNPEHVFLCDRKIQFQDKLLNCDSHLGYDGDNLRPIIDGVPDAMDSLDRYQSRQRAVKDLAYIGTLGLGMVLAGNLFFKSDDASLSDGDKANKKRIRYALIFSGLGVTVGAFTIGFITLRQNEKILMQAIDQHNQARPTTPIQVLFATGAHF